MNRTRFPENSNGICYLSMSEKTYDFNGRVSNCSHLYRDGFYHLNNEKIKKCKYGCNRRLVKFNQEVSSKLTNTTQ